MDTSTNKLHIKLSLGDDGNRRIDIIHEDGSRALIMIAKEDSKVYRLYFKDDHFEAVDLDPQEQASQHNPRM